MSRVRFPPGLPYFEHKPKTPLKSSTYGILGKCSFWTGPKINKNPFKIKHLRRIYFSGAIDTATDLWYHMYMDSIMLLRGKTRHGKNRVSQHGSRWSVVREDDSVLCLDGKPGKWVVSIDCACSTCEKWGQDGRWIFDKNDPNFEIVGRE